MKIIEVKMYFAKSAGPDGVVAGAPEAGKRDAQTEKARAISRLGDERNLRSHASFVRLLS